MHHSIVSFLLTAVLLLTGCGKTDAPQPVISGSTNQLRAQPAPGVDGATQDDATDPPVEPAENREEEESPLDVASAELSALFAAIENGNPELQVQALQELARRKMGGEQASAVLCAKLGDPHHTIRSLVASTLVALGPVAVPGLRQALRSESGIDRAAAAHALNRMGQLELAEMETLAGDLEPRVRAVAAEGLSHTEAAGIPVLVQLLDDPEPAVAIQATQALRVNHSDSKPAIEGLISVLKRPDVGCHAAHALASFGIEARGAIPRILKAYPLGSVERFTGADETAFALTHLGPPDGNDIPQVCEFLKGDDPYLRELTARWLAQLTEHNVTAAAALEEAVHDSLRRYESGKSTQDGDEDVEEDSYHWLVAAAECVQAFWRATQDPSRFLGLLQKLQQFHQHAVHFSQPYPWEQYTSADYQLLADMLTGSDPMAQQTVLEGLSRAEFRARPLKPQLLELLNQGGEELVPQVVRVLAGVGPGAADEFAPILITKVQAGHLSLQQFAESVERLELRSSQIEGTLERGLQEGTLEEAGACARALAVITPDRDRVARMVLEAAGRHSSNVTCWTEALERLRTHDTATLAFLESRLLFPADWQKIAACRALGQLGPEATPTVPRLRALLEDRSPGVRLWASAALLQIENDATHFRSLLEGAVPDWNNHLTFDQIRAIASLGKQENSFLPFLVTAVNAHETAISDAALGALQQIGSPAATAALEDAARSRDWAVQLRAAELLEEIHASSAAEDR